MKHSLDLVLTNDSSLNIFWTVDLGRCVLPWSLELLKLHAFATVRIRFYTKLSEFETRTHKCLKRRVN